MLKTVLGIQRFRSVSYSVRSFCLHPISDTSCRISTQHTNYHYFSTSTATMSDEIQTMSGTCLCKAVAVEVKDKDLFNEKRRGHICHCKNCRKVAGGIFGTNLIIEEEKVSFPNGKKDIKMYSDPETLSGTPVGRHFCQHCGVPIMSTTPLYAGKIVLKLGLYDRLPTPEWESFAGEAQTWEKPMPGTIQYKIKSFGEKMPGSPEKAGPAENTKQ